MSIILYDLVGADDRRFSPNCWRSRFAIAHKGLDCETRATRFTEIPRIADGRQRTIPVIEDGCAVIADSWAIAEHLEDAYPERPSLFGGDVGRALSAYLANWVNQVVHPGLITLIVLDVYRQLTPEDQPYFRESREKRFGRPLEQVQAGREERVGRFRQSLEPIRTTLQKQPFLCGDRPGYADHLVWGALQWARTVSAFPVLATDDVLLPWFGRGLDLYEGLGRREPGYY